MLFKYGGIYSDLDILTIKSLSPLISSNRSGVGYVFDHFDFTNGAFLVFPRLNHPYLGYAVKKFMKEYDGKSWAKNGPWLIKNAITEFCKVNFFIEIELYGFKPASFSDNKSHPCADMIIYPESFFYPLAGIHWEHSKAFAPNSSSIQYLRDKIKDSYAIHFYNQLSARLEAKIGDNSLYTWLAEKHCPKTYEYVKERKLNFSP